MKRGEHPGDKDPAICSRCGKPAEDRYICRACRSQLVMETRRKDEANNPAQLADRRRYKAEHSMISRVLADYGISRWGGKRKGAGRHPSTKERCACGKHTLARAVRLRLKCRML